MHQGISRGLTAAAAGLHRGARTLEALAARFGAARAERALSLATGTSSLAGTLSLPARSGVSDAVLILPGSGPVDRDGNTPTMRSDNLLLLANALCSAGYAVLRIDKRGIAESAGALGREEDATLATFVDDACAWVGLLRAQAGVGRVFLLGHSEGALVATLAAERTAPAAIVLVAGAGQPLAQVLQRQLRALPLPEALARQAERIIVALERGDAATDVPAELFSLFRPSVQPYLSSLFAVDPAGALAICAAPALVVQGSTDLQVGSEDARRLAAARPGIELAFIEGMNHALKAAPRERAAQGPAYSDPRLPLAPTLASTIIGFLNGTRPEARPAS